ncbi:hypothetical protein [Clostridium estertheticum]|uniref:Uncharacterized protein n=1 Tax=Clostridium estertheticum TaxID=238834 RepID=A0A7Y3T303_9CLOT|nr:hypothetical protein [Clostridium estertheticum]MBW9173379.1 hypothetical protein [Clostridium estertheticum]NNU78364.1 hypothetical protein [Clostridium estertheticum]WBL45282.1 hypothetical protein LOR37_11260 [Clostridium estertheticum]WLC73363.1 hypothetical protein KTC99_11085 [Clostridium estertheticum]
MDSVYSTIDFYSNLKLKYKEYLKPEIVSIVMIQSKEAVYLESIEIEITKGGFEKQIVRRINLDFIADDEVDEDFFNPKDTIENNVRKFIDEFSPCSISNTTDLFHDEACEKIIKKYKTFGIDR